MKHETMTYQDGKWSLWVDGVKVTGWRARWAVFKWKRGFRKVAKRINKELDGRDGIRK